MAEQDVAGTPTTAREQTDSPRRYALPLCLLIGMLIFPLVAFLNRYPLVWGNDTCAYLYLSVPSYLKKAFNPGFTPPIEFQRPVFYGWLIRVCRAFTGSLWGVVLCQAAATAYFIYLLITSWGGGIRFFLLTCVVLTFASTASWSLSLIMPDAMAGMLGIGLYLVLTSDTSLTGPHRIAVPALVFAALIFHNSFIPIAILSVGAYTVFLWARSRMVAIRPLVSAGLLIAAAILTLCLSNKTHTGRFTFSPMGSAFTLGRMAEDGIVYKLLKEHCDTDNYLFCRNPELFRKVNINEYLWGNGVMSKFGGLNATRAESVRVIRNSWRYYPGLNVRAVVNALRVQMKMFGVGDAKPSAVSGSIIWFFYKPEYGSFLSSAQSTGQLPAIAHPTAKLQRNATWAAIYVLLGVAVLSLRQGTVWHDLGPMSVFVLSFILANAFVISAFSLVGHRMQARVVWLAPLAAMVAIRTFLSEKQRSANA